MKTEKLGQQDAAIPEGPHVIHMQLDARAVEYVIYSLKNLYTNPLSAAFREYVANAVDANERAGSSRPVEITITYPNKDNTPQPAAKLLPRLRIRDYGYGMDETDLANFASYGFSDKRDSNAERGGYGYGGKSALAFTNEFQIVSIKAGIRYEVSVHAEFRQAGFFEIVSMTPTDEPAGVLIDIPLTEAQANDLIDSQAVIRQLRGYPAAAVLFNGRHITQSIHDATKYLAVEETAGTLGWVGLNTDDGNNVGYATWTNTKIAIGNIIYDLPVEPNADRNSLQALRYLNALRLQYLDAVTATNDTFYINFPIGSLELIPSRDSIQYNEANTAVIQAGIEKFFTALPHAAWQRVQGFDTAEPAIKFVYRNWGLFAAAGSRGDVNNLVTSWRGQPITAQVAQQPNSVWAVISSYVGRGVHRFEVEAHAFPLYQILQGMVTEQRHYQDNRAIILQVPEVTEVILTELEKKAREYGQAALQTDYLITYITDATDLEFWTAATIPKVDLATFRATVKTARTAKKARTVTAPVQRVLRYPITIPSVDARFTWISAAELPANVIYMPGDMFPEGDGLSSAFWFLSKNPQSRSQYMQKFADGLAAIVGDDMPVLVVPAGRSVTNFLKYAPQARAFLDLFVARITAVLAADDFDARVFTETIRVFQQATGRHERVYVDFRFLSTVLRHERDGIRLSNALYRGVIDGFDDQSPLHLLAQLTVNMQTPLLAHPRFPDQLRPALQPHEAGHQKRGLAGDLDVFDRTWSHEVKAANAHRIIRALNAYAPGD